MKAQREPSDTYSDETENLSKEEMDEYSRQEDLSAESIAEIKQAQAISNEKFEKLKRKILKNQVKFQTQEMEMRSEYASKAYRFVWLWSIVLVVLLLISGSKSPEINLLFIKIKASEFSLEKEVLIALISGVTVNIVAVFVVVIRNLFPSSHIKNEKNNKDSGAEL